MSQPIINTGIGLVAELVKAIPPTITLRGRVVPPGGFLHLPLVTSRVIDPPRLTAEIVLSLPPGTTAQLTAWLLTLAAEQVGLRFKLAAGFPHRLIRDDHPPTVGPPGPNGPSGPARGQTNDECVVRVVGRRPPKMLGLFHDILAAPPLPVRLGSLVQDGANGQRARLGGVQQNDILFSGDARRDGTMVIPVAIPARHRQEIWLRAVAFPVFAGATAHDSATRAAQLLRQIAGPRLEFGVDSNPATISRSGRRGTDVWLGSKLTGPSATPYWVRAPTKSDSDLAC